MFFVVVVWWCLVLLGGPDIKTLLKILGIYDKYTPQELGVTYAEGI